MRLRRRLTLTMGALLLVGLAVVDVVTYASLRSFLYSRLDNELSSSQQLAIRYLDRAASLGFPVTADGIDGHVGDYAYVLVVGRDGSVVVSRPSGSPEHPSPPPLVPSSLRPSGTESPLRATGQTIGPTFVLTAKQGFAYRAEASPVPQGTLVTAVPLAGAAATLGSLLRIELAVSVAVVVTLCALALWTVRRGLRPLDDMAETAGAIAAGDLTRRIDDVDDLTEVGRLGRALNAMLSQIEAGFADRSATEARLRQFVADASHELRTPLTSIRGYAELLRKGAFADPQSRARALARVEHEVARMGGLVDDLLLLARLDQGRPLVRQPVDLCRVCRDAVDDARLSQPSRSVELAAPGPVVVAGDRDRLAQVAHNLVRNALVHTPPASPVRVEVGTADGMGLLRVVDEGPGVDREAAERVFDRFYRANPSRTGTGTGLGLSIVRAIARALGGEAWAEPSPGAGAVFVVTVPLAVSGSPATSPGPDRSGPDRSGPEPGRGAVTAGTTRHPTALRGPARA